MCLVMKQAAKQTGAQLPLGWKAKEIYEELCKKGYATKDFGIVFQYINKKL